MVYVPLNVTLVVLIVVIGGFGHEIVPVTRSKTFVPGFSFWTQARARTSITGTNGM